MLPAPAPPAGARIVEVSSSAQQLVKQLSANLPVGFPAPALRGIVVCTGGYQVKQLSFSGRLAQPSLCKGEVCDVEQVHMPPYPGRAASSVTWVVHIPRGDP